MLGIFATTFKFAARERNWDGSISIAGHDADLRIHEDRKREELHRQLLQRQRLYRNWFRR